MLGNSAGGVARQRYCQPNLPPTLDQNTQASGVAMVSLQAAMLFFFNPILTHSYISEQFSAQAEVSSLCLCVRKDFVGSFQPQLNFVRTKNTSARCAGPDSPSHLLITLRSTALCSGLQQG